MKKYIVTKKQLNEYVESKKAEKIFNNIISKMYNNQKLLNEQLSIDKANTTVIENYKRKGLLTPKVIKKLQESKLIDENLNVL